MKKTYYFAVLALTLCVAAGCGSKTTDAPGTAGTVTESKETYESYLGDWKLKTAGDEKLYLLSAMELYFGATGISLDEIDGSRAKGSVYSISGAPSERQAVVEFEGDISGGTLTVPYEDKGWEYSGNLTLTFGENMITADITREKSEAASLWGIPEGRFQFVRPIDTEEMEITKDTEEELLILLSAVTTDKIEPFEEGGLTDEMIIDFAGINLGAGNFNTDKYGDRVKFHTEVRFDESVMNDIARTYFGTTVREPGSTQFIKYENGTYEAPLVGGVWAYPAVRVLLKDTENEGVYYALADYIFETPMQEPELEYQYLFKLEKPEGFVIKSITKIESPVDLSFMGAR